jgi:hypothetical protein
VAKSREDQNRSSAKDRWQRSRDLANSEVRKVRAQELGAPSCKWRNREEQGSPLDLGHGRTVGSEPHHAYHAFGGSKVERTSSRHQKSRNPDHQNPEMA